MKGNRDAMAESNRPDGSVKPRPSPAIASRKVERGVVADPAAARPKCKMCGNTRQLRVFGAAATGAPHTVALLKMVGHQGKAPCTPVWKTGVYLSTPMPVDREFHSALRVPRSAFEGGVPCRSRTCLSGSANRRLGCSANGTIEMRSGNIRSRISVGNRGRERRRGRWENPGPENTAPGAGTLIGLWPSLPGWPSRRFHATRPEGRNRVCRHGCLV
jgi:hypothetical protein